MHKTLPSNVAWFERLMYSSLGIGVIVSSSRWSRDLAAAGPLARAGFLLFVQAFVIASMVLFIWLIARRHKNWARWFILIIGLLGVPFYFRVLGQTLRFSPVAGTLMLVQMLLQVIAVFLIFTGNARDWFKQSASVTPAG
jgi:uncharacterized membrane protein HdeD (DUF308 family)